MNFYTFDELEVGLKAQIEIVVGDLEVDGFLKLSGDNSPIHVDDDFAKARNFDGKIAHGILLASYVSRFIGVHLPGANGLLQSIKLQYRNPCYPGTKIRITGEVLKKIEAVRSIVIGISIEDIDNGIILSNGTIQSGILDQSIS